MVRHREVSRIYGTGANIFAFEPSNLYFDLIERFEMKIAKICNIAPSDQNALIDFINTTHRLEVRLQKKSTKDQNLVLDGVLITLKCLKSRSNQNDDTG